MNLKDVLFAYVEKFNTCDEELYVQDIDNANAFEWMSENVPLFECPNKTLEEVYYFRWWTFRKHVKTTEDDYVITEFLPPVPWAGRHNTIVCPVEHHLAEARWLKCGRQLIEKYALFWLEEKSNTYHYTSALLYSVFEYCRMVGDDSFGIRNLDLMIRYYEEMSRQHRCNCGLFAWTDGHDGGEFSISGTGPELVPEEGIRPTFNSYMAANAKAIAYFAKQAGRQEIARAYEEEFEMLCSLILELLWDGEFFKAIHCKDRNNFPKVTEIPENRNVRELLGYIPWCYGLVPDEKEYAQAFQELKDAHGFQCPYGLTTAEQRHQRYLYEANHECLWNGYIWPFATSQTLNAVINLLECYHQEIITEADFFQMLEAYAQMHYLLRENGEKVCWIDEVMHPLTGEWSAREILKDWGWLPEKGGYERGKDYNHSTFCDLVIRGLLGVKCENGEVIAQPRIPQDWEYFRLENLWISGRHYEITYDKFGLHYGRGKGLLITEII